MSRVILTPIDRTPFQRQAPASGLTGQALSLATAAAPVIPPAHPFHGMEPPPTAEEMAAVSQALAEADPEDYGDDDGIDWTPWLDQITRDAGAQTGTASLPRSHPATADIDYEPRAALSAADDEDRAVTLALASHLADQGDYITAAHAMRQMGEPYLPRSDGSLADVNRIMDIALATERERQREDAQPLPRSSEDRMAHLIGRCARQSYVPQPSIGLATPASSAASALARHRWQQAEPTFWGAVIPGDPCGVVDEVTGRCAERYHASHCHALATPEIAQTLQTGGAYDRLAAQPWLDRGRVWRDQVTGESMTLSDHVLAASGTRRTPAPFTGQRRGEVPAAQRVARAGDVDDPGEAGQDLPGGRALAERMGLAPPRAVRERERERYMQARNHALAAVALRAHGRVHPDMAESARERAERLHRPVTLQEVEADPGAGGLMRYQAG